MFVPLACSGKILQYEEVLTALFVIETQLEWASSLIMRPFPSPLASPTVVPLLSPPAVSLGVLFCLFLSATGLHCRANSWKRRDKGGGGR